MLIISRFSTHIITATLILGTIRIATIRMLIIMVVAIVITTAIIVRKTYNALAVKELKAVLPINLLQVMALIIAEMEVGITTKVEMWAINEIPRSEAKQATKVFDMKTKPDTDEVAVHTELGQKAEVQQVCLIREVVRAAHHRAAEVRRTAA